MSIKYPKLSPLQQIVIYDPINKKKIKSSLKSKFILMMAIFNVVPEEDENIL